MCSLVITRNYHGFYLIWKGTYAYYFWKCVQIWHMYLLVLFVIPAPQTNVKLKTKAEVYLWKMTVILTCIIYSIYSGVYIALLMLVFHFCLYLGITVLCSSDSCNIWTVNKFSRTSSWLLFSGLFQFFDFTFTLTGSVHSVTSFRKIGFRLALVLLFLSG